MFKYFNNCNILQKLLSSIRTKRGRGTEDLEISCQKIRRENKEDLER